MAGEVAEIRTRGDDYGMDADRPGSSCQSRESVAEDLVTEGLVTEELRTTGRRCGS